MKTKLTSFLLVLSMLFAMIPFFSFVDQTVSAAESNSGKVKEYLHYLNSFGDSPDDFGGTISLLNATVSKMVLSAEPNGNKYGHFTFNDSRGNVFFQFTPSNSISTEKLGYLILEMDFNDFGKMITTNKMLEIHSGEGSLGKDRLASTDIINVGNSGGKNYFYFNNDKSNRITINSNEWVHIRCEISILSENATKYNLKCYIGDQYFEKSYSLGNPTIIKHIRIGSTNSTNQSFGLDNIALYSAPTNLQSYKDIGSVAKAIVMKIGAENAKINNIQTELNNPPMLVNGNIYCPIDVLEEYTGKTCPDAHIVNYDGVKYVHIDNIYAAFGLTAKSYDMGLIIIGDQKSAELYVDSDYTAIMDLMKTFVFNIPTPDALKIDVKDYTNNFDHPYLIADQEKFDYLRTIYNRGRSGSITDAEELALYDYINRYVNSAESKLKSISGASPTGVYNGIKVDQIPVNSNYSKYNNNGYDNGGRVNSIPSTNLYYLAFAYQMTGHLNYARAAYDYSLALGEWNHWGPSHFLNCADAAAPFAIAYDWLYDAYKILEANQEVAKFDNETYDTGKLVEILFTHAIIPGYIQSNAINCPWPGSVESRYATTTNNWNAVCTSGMLASALAIIGEEISAEGMTFTTQVKSNGNFTDKIVPISQIGNEAIHLGLTTYADYAAKLASMNMNSLMRYGLVEYAPDGSYVESPGYWTYGTNTFFRMVATLMTATGDDYGFMDSWGMDTTSYFAIHSESSDYKTWSYNDGGVGVQNSEFFMFTGVFYGDDNLIKVRKKQLNTGKGYSLFDILFYDTEVTGEPALATEYYMQGIDGYAVRSSWDKGAIYAGIMGGPNTVSHGHMDAGVFTYHNKGKIWFHDLGSDQYNITYVNDKGQNKGYFSNYELYRIGAEGHNIIAITSEQDTLPYGQATNADPSIEKYYSSTEGGYAIIDMSTSYGDHVKSAKRGMLFTDFRSTVVIQDEIVFNGSKTAYWFGHYNLATGYVDEVILSSDKRTAFMISGDDIIRVSIVSDNKNLSFEIMDAYTYLLDITHDTDRSQMDLPNTEYTRDTIRKLAIKCENVETLNLAVVIEEVSSYQLGTSYEWTDMAKWNVDGAQTPETEYKFKADYEDLGLHIGSVSANLTSEFTFDQVNSDNTYAIISSLKSGTANATSEVKFNFANNTPIYLPRYKYAVVDFSVYTESTFINGTSIGINSKANFIPLISLSGKSISVGTSSANTSGWTKVTIIFDASSGDAYVYVNNSYLSKIEDVFGANSMAINSLSLVIPSGTVSNKTSAVSLDDITFRTFGTLYDDTILSEIINKKSSLSAWSDNISVQHDATPIAITGNTYIYDMQALQAAIDASASISLLRDCPARLTISSPVSIDTNGYKFDFNTNAYILNIDGNIYHFEKGSIKVTWHIDGRTYAEYYSASQVAKFKYSADAIGKITEKRTDFADGGTVFEYFTTGWSNSNGGTYLSDDEMIVTSDNCDFWLVNNKPIECLFVVVSTSGNITPYYDESKLRSEIKSISSSARIVLCDDVEIMNTSALELSTYGKNLYLNNHTLKHAQNDVHTFIFNNAIADFNFYGPGNLISDGSRTMFTSTSSKSTNNYGVKLYNLTVKANVQLADLRYGQHEFVNCKIIHNPSSSKTFMTIWDRNGVPTTGGSVNGSGYNSAPVQGTSTNQISVKFRNCEITAGNGGSSPLISFTSGTYSEVYFIDTSVTTKGAIADASYGTTFNPNVKISFSGASYVNAKAVSTKEANEYDSIIFESGVVTNIQLAPRYMPSGAILASSGDSALVYKVASEYALVRWLSIYNTLIYEEYIAVGDTPAPTSTEVIKYLQSINGMDNSYYYNTTTVTSSETVNLTPVTPDSSSILQSMNLATDFALELYVPKNQLDNEIISLSIDGVEISKTAYSLANVSGTSYYRYRITRINPANAGKVYTVIVTYSNGSVKSMNLSVINYLERLITTTAKNSEKILAIKILKYIKSAYVYASNDNYADLAKLDRIIKAYQEYDLLYGAIKSESTGTRAVKEAISGANLYLSASARFRFVLNPTFTGTVEIEYLGIRKTYEVINGLYNGLKYIQVELSASDLNSSIKITVGENSIKYNVSSYYTALNTSDSALADLLFALNEYSEAAKNYLNN